MRDKDEAQPYWPNLIKPCNDWVSLAIEPSLGWPWAPRKGRQWLTWGSVLVRARRWNGGHSGNFPDSAGLAIHVAKCDEHFHHSHYHEAADPSRRFRLPCFIFLHLQSWLRMLPSRLTVRCIALRLCFMLDSLRSFAWLLSKNTGL